MLKWTILFLAVGIEASSDECPPISNSSSGRNVLMELTEPCRYDMWERPQPENGSTKVSTRIYVYFLGSVEVQHLHFTAHILIRFRWFDPRLVHNSTSSFQGENDLKTRLWTPHIYIVNEHDSQVMGVNKEDTLITVQPDGNVLYSKRLKVTLLCLMELQKFPFDEQKCPLVLESWMYNTTQLVLSWEKRSPVIINRHLQMTEYNLVAMWTNVSDVVYSVPEQASSSDMDNLHLYGKFAGTYSSLTVYFQLEREVGHYIMDYYVPSILLVVVSWVSFWLDPNAVPGRTTLGTSTMLTFITLSRNTGSSLPKVSYIKATEIWFIVCTGFIFGSLVEFAFVNTIWRRRNNIELKKVNSKHILKSTLTPQQKRRLSTHDSRSGSLPSMINGLHNQLAVERKKNKSDTNLSTLDNFSRDPFPSVLSKNVINIHVTPCDGEPHAKTFFTMTPQEIAQWIDRRSRLFFPLAFLVFNCFYWIFVWL